MIANCEEERFLCMLFTWRVGWSICSNFHLENGMEWFEVVSIGHGVHILKWRNVLIFISFMCDSVKHTCLVGMGNGLGCGGFMPHPTHIWLIPNLVQPAVGFQYVSLICSVSIIWIAYPPRPALCCFIGVGSGNDSGESKLKFRLIEITT